MAGRKAIAITERQFAALEVLWDRGPLTVRELMEHLDGGDSAPYTTVLGLLQTMEKAGLVSHEKDNAAHRYAPTLTRKEATGNLLSDFARRFFGGSAERLVLGLVDAEQLSGDDLRELQEKLAASKAAPPPRRRNKGKGREE